MVIRQAARTAARAFSASSSRSGAFCSRVCDLLRLAAVPAVASTLPEASTSSVGVYPFASGVVTSGEDRPAVEFDARGRPQGLGGMLSYANKRLIASHRPPPPEHVQLFARSSGKDAIRPGDVLEVSSYTTSAKTSRSRFAGVLIGVKRREEGTATSFTLRNVVDRTGVEMRYPLASPMIASITVLARVLDRKVFPRRRSVDFSRAGPLTDAQPRQALQPAREHQPTRHHRRPREAAARGEKAQGAGRNRCPFGRRQAHCILVACKASPCSAGKLRACAANLAFSRLLSVHASPSLPCRPGARCRCP